MTLTSSETPVDNSRITILVPIYNGSKYIAGTLSSIRDQSFQDFEVFCLDDCSTDGSREIIARFVEEDPRFKLIVSRTNQGSVSPVINAVLDQVETEFLTYSSQDDCFSTDWLQQMVNRQAETGADAILPDVIFVGKEPGEVSEIIGFHGDRSIVLTNREAVAASLDWTIHGLALWRSTIVKKHRFAEFSAYADEYSAREFFFACNRVAFSHGEFFSRQDNPDAITKKPSYRMFDAPRTALAVHDLLQRENFPLEIRSIQLLRSINIFIGMCRIAFKDSRKFPAGDFSRSKEALNGFFAMLPISRLLGLLRVYGPNYRARTLVKLMMFAAGGKLVRAATINQLRRAAVRSTDLTR